MGTPWSAIPFPTANAFLTASIGGLVARLPPRLRGLALLARFDRPIGWWLLFWPGAWGVALAGGIVQHWGLILWLLLGSIAMRGAGCVYNDIVDRDLDAQVARTRARPIPSGLVSIRLAWGWLVMRCAWSGWSCCCSCIRSPPALRSRASRPSRRIRS